MQIESRFFTCCIRKGDKMKKCRYYVIIVFSVLLSMINPVSAATEQNKQYYNIFEPWVYTVTNKIVINNPSNSDIRNISITLPLMDHNQPVYQELLGEEFNPWPSKISINENGTRKGVFNIPVLKPGQKVVLQQKYAVKNYAVDFEIEASRVSSDYDNYQGISSRYLQPEIKIESDHQTIVKYAEDLIKDETNPYLIARKLFTDINLFMTYKNGVNANKGALNAIRYGEGVCEDYTDLFVATARALGIPARWKTGYLYLPKEYTTSPYIREDGNLDISLMRHTWPEFYLPQIGWVVLDPTFTYTIKSGKREEKVVDWNKFAKIESNSRHIFFSYGSHDDDYIEYRYSGPKPVIEFSEFLEFGKNISPFRDVVNHWAKDNILLLSDYTPSIIGGYGNGLFGPNDYVTRAQLAAMLNRALTLDYNVMKPQFKDVQPGYWAYADISAAKGARIIGGYPDGSFKPDKPVSRAELAAILVRAFNLPHPAAGVSFHDLGKSGYAWADADIIILAGNGIAAGYDGGLFKPEAFVTRAEVATFLSRLLDPGVRLKL